MENIDPEKYVKSILDKLDLEIEKETLALKKKNEFILKLINEIGKAFDKNFLQIEKFDYESNREDLVYLFNYFDSLCDKEKEKRIAVHTISTIILQVDNLNDIWEKIINQVKMIIIQENYWKDSERRMNLVFNIMNDLKLVLTEEKKNYLCNFTKKFQMNIITLFELINYLITCDNNESKDMLYFTFKMILENYKKIIFSEDILKILEVNGSINLSDLNQLLLLNLKDEQNIIVFEHSKFQIKVPNEDELDAYIKRDISKKIKDYFYNNSMDKIITTKEEDNVNNTTKPVEISFENIDDIPLNPVEKFIVEKLKEYDRKFNNQKQINIQLQLEMSKLEMDLKKMKNQLSSL